MSKAVTSLSDIIQLCLQQYGIRFQVTKDQLVQFANHIQYIAFNQDLQVFEEWGQVFKLGQDIKLETDVTYTAPLESDIGLPVSGNISGVIGTLMNFRTQNQLNKWVVEPPDGGVNIVLAAQETLTIVGGTGAGFTCSGQSFDVSNGPYRIPTEAAGNPPFRKLIGVTQITDKQLFQVPPNNSFDGPDDYGLLLNGSPGRNQNYPYRFNMISQTMEIDLVSSTPPEITQTDEACGPGGTTLNTSRLRWSYYKNAPSITDITDEDKVMIPERYRYEILFMGISRMADTATYGDNGDVAQKIRPLCERFWEDMRIQYQQFGRNSDWISHGDNWDDYGLGHSNGNHNGRNPFSGQNWY